MCTFSFDMKLCCNRYYNTAKKEGKNFEIIFVSSDQDEASFNDYYTEMPWLEKKNNQKTITARRLC